ncbi:MAG: Gfo/Idh/MocA family protein [Dissulfurimicrobium sp.]|uniref:Gfo/Idh/MocA family protein n=1 Tax=Dissulfurimicrobium sp. TaxID=2022436 RepID=UPI00404937BA
MIRVAVIGAGYLGRFHAQKYAAMPDVELTGVVDTVPGRAAAVAKETGARAYSDLNEVIGRIDAASVVVPTVHHYKVSKALLAAGVHCLTEKPVTTSVQEADELIGLASKKGLVFQVGHIERFNPAIKVLYERVKQPFFIEAHRLNIFNGRATDVDVVLDLMIHDIDITLGLVRSPVAEILAVGAPVLTPFVDIANARVIFENGCTANFTASRISLDTMRRIRVFQPGGYISADCFKRKNLIVKRVKGADIKNTMVLESIEHDKDNMHTDMLYDEIEDFILAVKGIKPPMVTGEAGRMALDLALRIRNRIVEGLDSVDFASLYGPDAA